MLEMRKYMHRMYTNTVIERIVLQKTKHGDDALMCAVLSGSPRAVQVSLHEPLGSMKIVVRQGISAFPFLYAGLVRSLRVRI